MGNKRNIFLFAVVMIFSIIIFSSDVRANADTDYRFEFASCIFSYIFPGPPSVEPIWRDNAKKHNKFLKKLPLSQKNAVQGIMASYKNVDFMGNNKLLMQTYCLNLDTKEENNNIVTADDMLEILKAAIGTMDEPVVKAALAREGVSYVKQDNNVRWMSLRGDVQQIINDKPETVSHFRDVFAYGDQVLLVMISYVDSGNNYQETVDTLLRSLILAE